MSRGRRAPRWLAVAALVAALAGCSSGGGTGHTSAAAAEKPWFAACDAGPTGGPSVAPTGGTSMPAISLPCFTGGRPVALAAPSGTPTVVNLWASWCAPCRTELPVFQRLSTAAPGRVRVLGVVTADTRSAALALAEDLHVTFPAVYDAEGRLSKALGRTALPITLFVDPGGRLTHVYNGTALDDASLAALVRRYLKVDVR